MLESYQIQINLECIVETASSIRFYVSQSLNGRKIAENTH